MATTEQDINKLVNELIADSSGGINPSETQLRELLLSNPNGPLQFLNLLAFHPTAQYPANSEHTKSALTGAEAYGLYGATAFRHIVQRGGRLVIFNEVQQQLIGDEGNWQQVAIMEYPNVDAFIDMLKDPDYHKDLVHRDAGLARTEVIVTRSLMADPA